MLTCGGSVRFCGGNIFCIKCYNLATVVSRAKWGRVLLREPKKTPCISACRSQFEEKCRYFSSCKLVSSLGKCHKDRLVWNIMSAIYGSPIPDPLLEHSN